jgi:hypothetical protein
LLAEVLAATFALAVEQLEATPATFARQVRVQRLLRIVDSAGVKLARCNLARLET